MNQRSYLRENSSQCPTKERNLEVQRGLVGSLGVMRLDGHEEFEDVGDEHIGETCQWP